MVLAGALARKSGRRAGTAPEWPLCRRLARLRGAAPRPPGRAMAPLPGRPPPRCVAGLPRRKPASDGSRPRRARYCSHTNSFRIASSLHSDMIFGRDRAHSMSFCRFFYTSWPDVVAAAPYCQTTLVIRMSTGSSPSALAPARGSRFVYRLPGITTRQRWVFCSSGLSSSLSSWEGGDFTLSMQNVLSAIKWSVCITIKPAGDIYSRTLVHAPSLCTKELATASTIPRRSSASVQALLRSSILARTKISTSNCRSSLSSKAGVLPPLSAGTSVCAPELTVKADTLIRQCHKRRILGDSWACGLRWRAQHLQKYPSGPMFAAQNN